MDNNKGFSVEHLNIVLAVSDGEHVVYVKTKEQALELMHACDSFVKDVETLDSEVH